MNGIRSHTIFHVAFATNKFILSCFVSSSPNYGQLLWEIIMYWLTWRLAVVAKVRYQNGLCINNDNGVGRDTMHTVQCVDFVRPRIFQCLRDGDVAEIYLELIAPHRKPFDVAQRFALGQRQCYIFIAVALDNAGAAALVTQSNGSLVMDLLRIAHVEVCG